MMNTNPNIDKKISFIGTLISSGKIGEAEPLLQELLESSGNNSELLHQMGVIKYFQGFYEEAIHYLSSAIKYKKNNSDYYFWRALSYGRKNDNLRAIIDYRKSLSLNANNASCIHNYAKALGREGEWQSAFKQVERAIKIRPEDTDILVTKGFIEFKLDQLEAADHTFKEILKSHPQHYEAMYFRGFTNLKQKNFEIGWELFDHRWNSPSFLSKRYNFETAEWNGSSGGEKLLIWDEQGPGDQIMCSLFFNKPLGNFKEIIILCDPRLQGIFSRCFDKNITFLPNDYDIKKIKYDEHLSMFGLLKYYAKQDQDPKTNEVILKFDNNEVNRIKGKLKGEKKICGISWFSENNQSGKDRSYSLLSFLKSFGNSMHDYIYVNLQYNSSIEEISQVSRKLGVTIYNDDEIDLFNDIDGLLNLAGACDFIISIDNTTIHLAGAAGINTHVLLNRPWDWRWLDGTNIWYPTTHCYHQEEAVDRNSFLKQTISKICQLNN
ncbi:MAG: hypothetical protein CML92_03380 [Rhodobiaceae bacterium]|nr:hypothetical protein [Rhodobiaceae bacterium]